MLPEVQQYLKFLDDLHGQIRTIVTLVPADALNWRPLEGPDDDHTTNSLAVLAAHVAGSEHHWIAEVVGRYPPTRNRPAEFHTETKDPAALIARLDEVSQETAAVLTSLDAADLDSIRELDGRVIPVRWAILHAIEHLALHLGHAQMTYQLWQGGETAPRDRWFERLQKR
ncbi:MAG: DinB family protein [Chloroflexota bacterium]